MLFNLLRHTYTIIRLRQPDFRLINWVVAWIYVPPQAIVVVFPAARRLFTAKCFLGKIIFKLTERGVKKLKHTADYVPDLKELKVKAGATKLNFSDS